MDYSKTAVPSVKVDHDERALHEMMDSAANIIQRRIMPNDKTTRIHGFTIKRDNKGVISARVNLSFTFGDAK